MKTPVDIKKGLYHCGTLDVGCTGCPYDEDCHTQGEGSCSVEADALAYIKQLEQRLAQVERERDALEERIHGECSVCANGKTAMCNDCIHNEWAWHPRHDYWKLDGVCEENTKEESQ